ncbi:hypothetical protein HK101_003687, partial [Irineochytrium annulatum]
MESTLGALRECIDGLKLPPAAMKALVLAEVEAARAVALTEVVLDVDRKPTFERADVEARTRATAAMFAHAVKKLGMEIALEVVAIKEDVYVNLEMWDDAVMALLAETIRHTESGTITCQLKIINGSLELTVEGSCSSAAKERRPSFLNFSEDGAPEDEDRSYTVEAFAAWHGGTVVATNPATGVKCVVTIPTGFDHLPPDRVILSSAPSTPRQNGVAADLVTRIKDLRLKENGSLLSSRDTVTDDTMTEILQESNESLPEVVIFVVHEDERMREALAQLLPYTVRQFDDGNIAFRAATGDPPDLIVSVTTMSGMSGLTMVRELRKNFRTIPTPVILLSDDDSEDTIITVLDAGADDCMKVNPFTAKALLARVKTRLELSRIRRRAKDRAEMQYLQLTKASPIAFFWADTRNVVTSYNDELIKLLDLTDDALARFKVEPEFRSSLMLDDDRARFEATWIPGRKARRGMKIEYRIRQFQTANIRWIQHEAIVETNAQGDYAGHLHCLTDITITKQLEKERLDSVKREEAAQRRRADDAEESRRQQEGFIDMICHEIRNPLNGIMNSNELMVDVMMDLKKLLDEKGLAENRIAALFESGFEATAAIALCAKHQKAIADDVLTMSKLNMSLLQISAIRFQPLALIRSLLKTFKADLSVKRIDAEVVATERFEILQAHDATFEGDPSRLSQVLINLLTNAIKFTEKVEYRKIVIQLDGEVPKEGEKGRCLLYISVKDSGIGMSEEERKLLFQRFSQASVKTYAEYGGSGLGLFISKRLIEMMGGTIDVESVKGHGCTFTFGVNVGYRPGKLIEVLAGTHAVDLLNGSANYRFLVVDDNDINRKVLGMHLKMLGHVIDYACDGRQAFNLVSSKYSQFDMVLMDIEMPILDGCGATRLIRQYELAKNVKDGLPIVAVTGNGRKELMELAIASGMQKVVLKPFTKQ